jgi:crotonobetaine/carnitine-CoA ligase
MTTAIYAEPLCDDDNDNPVRFVLSAGMPQAIWDDFKARFNIEIFEFYGCAEGGLTLNSPGSGGPAGSVGKPPPGAECSIRDDDDREVPNGEFGEMCFRNADGSCPPVEYYKNPDASAAKTVGGWFRSGDIGHKDADGWVYFDYRAGGGIRRNGDFINAAFVEKTIAETPAVKDVFVYGVHTPANAPGEKEVIAAIVTRDAPSFDAREIFSACRRKLESNFVPSFLQVVDEIPKTASEKPQERFLLDRFDENGSNVFSETA